MAAARRPSRHAAAAGVTRLCQDSSESWAAKHGEPVGR